MKLPAVALVAAFAVGVATGGVSFGQSVVGTGNALALPFLVATGALAAGLLFLRVKFLKTAAVFSLLAWFFAGATAAHVERHPLPANHVLSLLATKRIDTNMPLRWRGRLREDPVSRAWGTSYEVDLDAIATGDGEIPAQGGVRFNTYENEPRETPPAVRAGDRVEILAQAHVPQQYKNPGAFERREFLAREGIHLTGTLRSPHLLTKLDSPPPSLAHRIARIRYALRQELDSLVSDTPKESAVLRAMLLGDKSFVERPGAVAFQKSGTYHVLVVAGLHTTALVVFLYWLTRRARLPLALTTAVTLLTLAGYVAIVEDRPPILRASLMAAGVLLGRLFYRRLDLLNTLALAALAILIARPLSVFDPSFQLSILAVATIGGVGIPWLDRTAEPYLRALRHLQDVTRDGAHPPRATQLRIDLRLASRWIAPRLPRSLARFSTAAVSVPLRLGLRLWELLAVSLALQLGMLPLLALYFHRVTFSGPFANIPAVTLTGVLVPLGFVALAVSYVWSGFARAFAAVLASATHFLVSTTEWFASLPLLSYRIPAPPTWLLIFFFLAFALFIAAFRFRHRGFSYATLFLVALAASAVAAYPFPPRLSTGRLEVTVLDVGQGDSILVVSPKGHTMLVDGGGSFAGYGSRAALSGPDPGEDAVSPYLWWRGIQQLDVVVLTHAHQDHLGGLTAIFENFRIGSLWIGREVDDARLRSLEDLARRKGVPVVHQMRGSGGDWDGVQERVLWPDIATENVAPSAQNNDSLVLRLQYGHIALLLPGDIERQAESQILAESDGSSLEADFLKIAHHGSRNSTLPDFLARVRPRFAVISVGEQNPYGHPSPELLERLRTTGVRVLRTDRDGAVSTLADGRQLTINCFVACESVLGRRAGSSSAPAPQKGERREN